MYEHIPGCMSSFMKELLQKNSKSSSKISDENSNTVTMMTHHEWSSKWVQDSSDSVLPASFIVVQEKIDQKSQMEYENMEQHSLRDCKILPNIS